MSVYPVFNDGNVIIRDADCASSQGDAVAAPTVDVVSTRRSDSRNWLTHKLALHKPRLPNNEPQQGM